MLIGVNRVMLAFLALPAVALLGGMLFGQRDWIWSKLAVLTLFALASGSLWLVKQPSLIRVASLTANLLIVAMAAASIRRDTLESGVRLMTGLEVLLIGMFFFVPLCLLARELFVRRRALH